MGKRWPAGRQGSIIGLLRRVALLKSVGRLQISSSVEMLCSRISNLHQKLLFSPCVR